MNKIILTLALLLSTVACSKQVDPVTGHPIGSTADRMQKAAEACKTSGKTLASFQTDDFDVKFTCE